MDNYGKIYVRNRINFFSAWFGLDLGYFLAGGFWLTAGTIISGLGGIFLSAMFARFWPKETYGAYSFLTSLFAFLTLTALPGMGLALVQAISEGKEGFYLRSIKLVAKFSVIGTLALVVSSFYFFIRHNNDLSIAILLSSLSFPLLVVGNLYNSFYIGKKNFRKLAILTTISQIFSAIITVFALIYFPSLVVVSLFSNWSTALVNIVFVFKSLKQVKNRVNDNNLVKLGKAVSLSTLIFVGAEYFDKFAVSILLGFEKQAIYSFAIIIPIQMQSFAKIFVNLAQPKIVDVKDNVARKALIQKSLQLELIFVFLVFIYIMSAPLLFKMLFPAYSESAVLLSQIFSLTLLSNPCNLFNLYLAKKRALKKGLFSSIIYASSTVLVLLIFLPLWGLMGAVLAKVFVKIIQVITALLFFESEIKATGQKS
jgi:O-antigen/teichoic acid export membrane protein